MLAELVLILPLLLGLSYLYLQRKWTYWSSLGIKTPPVTFPIGNNPQFHKDVVSGKKNTNCVAREQYESLKGKKYYGVYSFTKPALVISDPEVMKQIMVKDFGNFVDRVSHKLRNQFFGSGSKSDRVWLKHLTIVGGEEWKDLRSMFSPIFTSGKMKSMMGLIQDISGQLVKAIEDETNASYEIDLKKTLGKFSMDAIASCAFGVDAGSFKSGQTIFVKNAKEIVSKHLSEVFLLVTAMIPVVNKIFPLFGISIFKPKANMFFFDVVKRTIDQRLKTNARRNDLIDMMIDAIKGDNSSEREDGVEDQFEADAKLVYSKKTSNLSGEKEFDEFSIISTAIVFLVAGYDTTAQTMSYLTYLLAMNPDIQQRLQEEIDAAVEEAGGKTPDYTIVQNLQYLDQAIHETLRLYPALGVISRACTEDYVLRVPGSANESVKIPKDMEVLINVAGLHKDPKYYPNPDKFDPERFSKENKAKRHPYTFLGFGSGPRNCVGMRFALLEAKIGMVDLLSKFTFVKSERTPETITIDPGSQLTAPLQTLYVRAERR